MCKKPCVQFNLCCWLGIVSRLLHCTSGDAVDPIHAKCLSRPRYFVLAITRLYYEDSAQSIHPGMPKRERLGRMGKVSQSHFRWCTQEIIKPSSMQRRFDDTLDYLDWERMRQQDGYWTLQERWSPSIIDQNQSHEGQQRQERVEGQVICDGKQGGEDFGYSGQQQWKVL